MPPAVTLAVERCVACVGDHFAWTPSDVILPDDALESTQDDRPPSDRVTSDQAANRRHANAAAPVRPLLTGRAEATSMPSRPRAEYLGALTIMSPVRIQNFGGPVPTRGPEIQNTKWVTQCLTGARIPHNSGSRDLIKKWPVLQRTCGPRLGGVASGREVAIITAEGTRSRLGRPSYLIGTCGGRAVIAGLQV